MVVFNWILVTRVGQANAYVPEPLSKQVTDGIISANQVLDSFVIIPMAVHAVKQLVHQIPSASNPMRVL